jgi:hypothetical protein
MEFCLIDYIFIIIWPIDSAQQFMVTILNIKVFKQTGLRGYESPGLSGRI